MMEWLMVFAADVMNLFHRKHTTGRSQYEEVVQHEPKHAIAGFGGRVLFWMAADKTDRGKFDASHETGTGVFLGWRVRSMERLVMTKDGSIYKTRIIRRFTADKAYDPDCVHYVKVG